MKKRRVSNLRSEVEEEMARTAMLLRQAREGLDWADDPDLIDAWIFQEQAMRAKYSYLIKRRKALEAGEEAAK